MSSLKNRRDGRLLGNRWDRRRWLAGVLAPALICVLSSAAVATAAPAAPKWQVTTVPIPTVMHPGPGQEGIYDVIVENVGAVESSGPVTLKDTLSPGAVIVRSQGRFAQCGAPSGGELECAAEPVPPGGIFEAEVPFQTTASVSALTNTVTVSGGGSPSVTDEATTQIGSGGQKRGGISTFDFNVTGQAGEPDVQAGGHPTFATTRVLFNNELAAPSGIEERIEPVENVKDLSFYLPLGFFGNPQLIARCPAITLVEPEFPSTKCPAGSRIGSILPLVLGNMLPNVFSSTRMYNIYNMAPEKGYAAQFAFGDVGLTFSLYVNVVRHDGRYMLRVSMPGNQVYTGLFGALTTLDGDVHGTDAEGLPFDEGGFLSNPSACTSEPITASVEANTWEHPGTTVEKSTVVYPDLTGCEQLGFSPVFSAQPETTQADEPSGYRLGVHVPQAQESFSGLDTPPLRDVSITLPAGTSLSTAGANGLTGCQETGSEGIDIEGQESEAPAADGLPRPVAGHCPAASRIGTVSASTPLLSTSLTGHVFLATPKCGGAGQHECGPQDAEDGSLFGLYLELEAPGAGVNIKLPGTASVNPTTGQITASFDNAPQFPLQDVTVQTNGGPRAPLANPQSCGTVSSTGAITPWSSAAPDVLASGFVVDADGAGGACPPSPFAPAFSAGTTRNSAGALSPFTLTLTRQDREQDIQSLSATLPPGLLALVSKATQCPEPVASDPHGGCPVASQVGTVTVGVGSGSSPLYVQGKVYFTGPYGGAPFGLSVLVPAVAGPFNLGDVLVRVALSIDPRTAQVTAVSGALPQIIDGVPLRIRVLNITLDDPQFTFNPTSCQQLQVTGTVVSSQGASANVSTPFAAAGCGGLGFHPTLSAVTKGKTTRSGGASLDVKVAYPSGAQANIHSVAVTLPKQLPARLSTVQQACPAATFEANPASCDAGSLVGVGTASTPVLSTPLTGPAYLVSHGGESFPDIVVVLQGQGVTIDLVGNIFIAKSGLTSATFAQVPDAPISAFDLNLPEGPHSALTNSTQGGSLCGQALTMPATLTGQNGAQIKQSTKINIAGCPKAKKKKAKKHKKHPKKAKKARNPSKGR